MGEAKTKEAKRILHARKIVDAFEAFIDAKVAREEEAAYFAKNELISVLVTPPPK